MGRSLVDVRLHDRQFRKSLKPRHYPYWRGLTPGFHLGYYRGPRSATWIVRYRPPQSDLEYVQEVIGQADDLLPADGQLVLSWAQALEKATEWVRRRRIGGTVADEKATVRSAIETYIDARDERDSARRGRIVRSDAASRLTAYVLSDSYLSGVKLADLSEGDLRNWQRRLADQKSTTKQRLINDLKAALNAAYLDHRLGLPLEFPQTVKVGLRPIFTAEPRDPVARMDQVLTDEQVRKIIKAAEDVDEDGDFGRLVLLLAATGARFSQLARVLVQDVQADENRLLVPRSRKGRGKAQEFIRIPVDGEVIDRLRPIMDGRARHEPLLERWRRRQIGPVEWVKDSRGPWKSASEMTRMWQAVMKQVGMPPTVVPYALRHSSVVRALTHDLPIRLVAALHDTSVPMIERFYSRWITDKLDDLASEAALTLVSR